MLILTQPMNQTTSQRLVHYVEVRGPGYEMVARSVVGRLEVEARSVTPHSLVLGDYPGYPSKVGDSAVRHDEKPLHQSQHYVLHYRADGGRSTKVRRGGH